MTTRSPIRSATGRLAPLSLMLLALLTLSACGTAHHARPLGKGNHAVHASIGGPVAGVGKANTFAPLTTLTYKAGLTDRADLFVGWHVLETFLNEGNAFFDIGASYYFLDQKGARPGISGAFTISPLINKTSGWASFDLQVTASWAFGPRERHLVYIGFHNYFAPVRNDTIPTAPYSWSPYFGGQLRVGKNRQLGLSLELKWHRPYASTEAAVMSYLGPGNMGAISFLSGITVYIGRDMKPAAQAPTTTEADDQ